MELDIENNKHTSTMIRKKWKKTPKWYCCGRIESYNMNKPMRKGYYCSSSLGFYKRRHNKVLAELEIMDIMR